MVNIGFIILIFSFCYSLMLNILFFSKKHVNTIETSIFGKMVFINLIGIILEMMCIFSLDFFGTASFFAIVINKIFLLYFIIILFLFLNYVINTANSNEQKKYNFIKYSKIISKIILFISIVLLFVLKIELFSANGIAYSYGPSVNLIYILSGITSIYSFTSLLVNYKTLKSKKNIPIFAFLILMGVTAIIQQFFPQITLATSVETFVIFLMYFTIENPDLKILQEYTKNRELVEEGLVARTNLLFKISEDIKTPIKEIKKYSCEILNESNSSSKDKLAIDISQISSNMLNSIDEIYNITNFDKSKIKLYNDSYDIYNLFSQIVYISKSNNVNLKYSITDLIPNKLFGDSTKLKQIICSLILYNNSNKKDDFVDIDIYSINKFDICRLIITIQNNLCNLDLSEINDILSSDVKIDDNELLNLENLSINLKLVKKLISLIGGVFIISSENDITTFKIIIDQIIDEKKVDKNLEKISTRISNKKKILILDDNYKELIKISNEFKKNDFEVVSVMYENDFIQRLSNKEKFDIVIVDDEMNNTVAINIVKKIDELNITNLVKIVMLDASKESIKKHYITDYSFSNYLLKDNYKEEVKKISDKYK